MEIDASQVRARLERRRQELLTRTQRVKRDLTRAEGALSPDFSEQAVEVENDSTLAEIARTAISELAAIDAALARLEAGKYGFCKSCGKQIEAGRLAAVPYSDTCRACSD
jgi:RNA polymerase-binding transcription factor DksA